MQDALLSLDASLRVSGMLISCSMLGYMDFFGPFSTKVLLERREVHAYIHVYGLCVSS